MAPRRAEGARDTRDRPLGQHFLRDRAVAARLVRAASIARDEVVVEIGAGRGIITTELAARAAKVLAVELDPRLAAGLHARFRDEPRVDVVQADALQVPAPDEAWRAFGNIPFGITTELLRHLLDNDPGLLLRSDLIVQWEVARKRAAAAQSNLLSLGWAPWWQLRILRRVPRNCFRPVPRVDAALLSVTRREPPLLDRRSRRDYVRFVRSLFAHPSGRIGPALDAVTSHRSSRRAIGALGMSRSGRVVDLEVDACVSLFTMARPPLRS